MEDVKSCDHLNSNLILLNATFVEQKLAKLFFVVAELNDSHIGYN